MLTGTLAEVGAGIRQHRKLRDGDVVEVELTRAGVLRTPVRVEERPG